MGTQEIRTSGGVGSLSEHSVGRDGFAVGGIIPMREKGIWKAKWTIYKFKGQRHDLSVRRHGEIKSLEDAMARGLTPYEVFEHEGNLLLDAGITQVWDLVCGVTATVFSSTALMAVGTSTTAATHTQSGLIGTGTAGSATATMTGSPVIGGGSASWQASFGTAVANFVWNEIGVESSASVFLNRLVQSMGTKASGTTWVATLAITLS